MYIFIYYILIQYAASLQEFVQEKKIIDIASLNIQIDVYRESFIEFKVFVGVLYIDMQ